VEPNDIHGSHRVHAAGQGGHRVSGDDLSVWGTRPPVSFCVRPVLLGASLWVLPTVDPLIVCDCLPLRLWLSLYVDGQRIKKKKKKKKMPRHLISDAHEWINEIPTVPIYYLAKPLPRERAWKN